MSTDPLAAQANPYRQRILADLAAALQPLGPIERALDFGAGDGFFAHHLPQVAALGSVTPVDVVARAQGWLRPQLYPGDRLPFADRSFDLAYAVDVLHHCPDPLAALADLARCSRRHLLIKDHHHHGPLGKLALGVMDELGNRRFGIPSPYLYQRDWAWVHWIESQGFRRRLFVHPMRCHVGLMGALTNGLQFMGLWEREGG